MPRSCSGSGHGVLDSRDQHLADHPNALERKGLVRRWREESNRRVQRVELTDEGSEVNRLREVGRRHDQMLRSQLRDKEVEPLGALLERIEAGVQEQAR